MNFQKVQKSYDKNAIVQFEMAKKMAALIKKYSPSAKKVLEVGPGTGFLTKHLFELFKGEIYLNDINENQTGLKPKNFILGDIMETQLPKGFDFITSNAVFQWIENREKLYKKINKAMDENAILIFSTFGEENYKQFKDFGGINYLNHDKLEEVLKACGFEICHLEEQIFTLYFETPKEILRHIRTTGVSTFNSYGLWTKGALAKFEKEYLEKNQDSNGVGLTYHPIYCVCKKICETSSLNSSLGERV